jgi:hypothetical protein
LASVEFSGIADSRMSVMRMVLLPLSRRAGRGKSY